jgi:hypothetical protein
VGDARARELIDLGTKAFSDKNPLDCLNQEIAENIYPERANFTRELILGEDFSSHLMDSYPVLVRRELGNSISAMLRPKDKPWFRQSTMDDDLDNDPEVAKFLEYMTKVTRAGIYDTRTKFIRATKEADHDFVSFGQPVISVEEAPSRDHLYYRCHHLRDCAWYENEIGDIDHLHRKDKMTARTMRRKFGEKVLHESVKRACEKSPGQMFDLRVVVMPSDEYDYVGEGSKNAKGRKHPFVIVYIDVTNERVLKEGGLPEFLYVVPRWHTIPGSQYAFSPAAMTALPDARMMQDLARIILESGEKAVDPPLAAKAEAVREANIQAGGITWVDLEHDGKISDAFAPVNLNADMRTGFAMRTDVRDLLSKAFFIDKLALPEAGAKMTAYEISQRLEEHVRNLLPLFEPMEAEYNTQLLDKSFALLANMNKFDWSLMPDILSKTETVWRFRNPMQEISERILVSQFQEALEIEAAAAQAGVAAKRINFAIARDDALRGMAGPAKWRKSDDDMAAEAVAATEAVETQEMLGEVAQGAALVDQVSDASMKLGQAMQPRQPVNGGALKTEQPKALPAPKRKAA